MASASPSMEADVIVVGGRVAGSLAAAYLSARDMRVILLEAGSFPSDTMSTHFFRGDGLVRSLYEIGVLDEVLLTGAPRFEYELFHIGTDTHRQPPQEPGDSGFGLSVRRVTLDAILARHVTALSRVDVRTRTRVEGLLTEDGTVVGVRLTDGTPLRAAVVVGADGRRSAVAQRVKAVLVQHHQPARVMYFQYVRGWTAPEGGTPEAPEFSFRGNELAYVFPSDHAITCVALSIPVADWTTSRQRRAELFAHRLRAHSAIWPRLEATTPVGGLVAAPPSPSVIVQAAGSGWALVGDASAYQDPWSGYGMDTAARQASALAECLADTTTPWQATYPLARDAVTVERFTATVTGAPDLSQLVGG